MYMYRSIYIYNEGGAQCREAFDGVNMKGQTGSDKVDAQGLTRSDEVMLKPMKILASALR